MFIYSEVLELKQTDVSASRATTHLAHFLVRHFKGLESTFLGNPLKAAVIFDVYAVFAVNFPSVCPNASFCIQSAFFSVMTFCGLILMSVFKTTVKCVVSPVVVVLCTEKN